MADAATAGWDALLLDVALGKGERRPSINPCIALYGPGPEGRRCDDCRQMFSREYSRRYWKCHLRRDSGGPATDHRLQWPACGRFEPREEA